jgi:carboxyl-terminal processing protease
MRMRVMIFALATMLSIASFATESVELGATMRHQAIGNIVSRYFSSQHYRRQPFGREFSSQVLDRYIETLDPQRVYFMAEDLAAFERYRGDLTVRLQNNNVDPGFAIFDVYRQRMDERMAFVQAFVAGEPDFTVEESFQYDRREADWAADVDELNELWRLRLKNESIGLLLGDREWSEAAEILGQRYEQRRRSVFQADSDNVFEAYINAFAWIMDPHSQYLSPISADEYQIDMSASVEGVGATLNVQDDYVTVVTVIPGGPAFIGEALAPDDRIIGVAQGEDGAFEDVVGWRLIDVVQLIRGPKDSTVRLKVLPAVNGPEAEPVVRSIVRDRVTIEAARAAGEIFEVDRGEGIARIGVITVPNFYADLEQARAGVVDYTSVSRDIERLVGELEDQGMDALMIDLRNNGGGYLAEVTRMAGLFIDSGPIVQTRFASGGLDVQVDPSPNFTIYDGPLAVLVNRYSASATEIFAAAVQDYERGVILGQRTYGKGTIQDYVALSRHFGRDDIDAGHLKFTMGKYYRVTGESTQNRGVIPDIELPSRVDEDEVGESIWDTALPWDTIAPIPFQAGGYLITDTLPAVEMTFEDWATGDADLTLLSAEIEQIEAMRDETEVSLVLETRIAGRDRRRDERLMLENEYRLQMGLDPIESLEALEDEDQPDLTLRLATEILGDLWRIHGTVTAELRQQGTGPTS